MRVFVSWSGKLSQLVAILLRKWLRHVIQVVEPYMSSEDIEKGSRWFADIDSNLDQCGFGIVCLTRENMTKPWILFEAGAVSRSIDRSRVTPLLIDLSPADLNGPLAQFQATSFTQTDMLRLVKDIGSYLGDPRFDDALIEQSFNKWWPDFQQAVMQVIKSAGQHEPRVEVRSDREILEELLQTTRNIAQMISSPPSLCELPAESSVAVDPIVEEIKHELEKRRKMFLVTVLEGATRVSLEGDELYIEFEPNARHLRDTIAKADNVKIIREASSIVVGREIGIRIGIQHNGNRERSKDQQRLKELAESNPVVQKMLRTFRGEIKEVRRVDDKQD